MGWPGPQGGWGHSGNHLDLRSDGERMAERGRAEQGEGLEGRLGQWPRT